MTKERLREYLELKKEKAQIEEQIEAIEAELYSPKSQKLTGMPAAQSNGSVLEEKVARHTEKMEELLEFYWDKKLELAEEILAIEKAIQSLEPVSRRMFRFRYIRDLSWEDVCVRINYSWRQTHRLHSDALEALRVSDARSDDRA